MAETNNAGLLRAINDASHIRSRLDTVLRQIEKLAAKRYGFDDDFEFDGLDDLIKQAPDFGAYYVLEAIEGEAERQREKILSSS